MSDIPEDPGGRGSRSQQSAPQSLGLNENFCEDISQNLGHPSILSPSGHTNFPMEYFPSQDGQLVTLTNVNAMDEFTGQQEIVMRGDKQIGPPIDYLSGHNTYVRTTPNGTPVPVGKAMDEANAMLARDAARRLDKSVEKRKADLIAGKGVGE
jgi:hypothetical protein